MDEKSRQVLEAALSLPEEQRASIAEALLETLPPEPDEWDDDELASELDRRLGEAWRSLVHGVVDRPEGPGLNVPEKGRRHGCPVPSPGDPRIRRDAGLVRAPEGGPGGLVQGRGGSGGRADRQVPDTMARRVRPIPQSTPPAVSVLTELLWELRENKLTSDW